MKVLWLPLFFLISGFTARAAILPEIFYAPKNEQERFCAENKFQTEEFWRELISENIDLHVKDGSYVLENSFVTLSYLELFKIPSRSDSVTFMGYVYANASHHLGRLVRFRKWSYHHPAKAADQELVKGVALRLIAQTASHGLSRRLMYHSLNLYKELAWSLASAHLCGNDYALKLVSDQDLIAAYSAEATEDFVSHFVRYEQTYLQKTMYSDFIIRPATKGGVLDEMRFISFNGEKQTSFRSWCMNYNCQTTSFDLENRIKFDVDSILKELGLTGFNQEVLNKRIEAASILNTALIFSKLPYSYERL